MDRKKQAKRLLLRADDLGFSEGVNYGVEKSVTDGLIRTIGVMTNMEASEHGAKMLRGRELCFGQHTNICAGRPLTDPARIPSITRADGTFRTSAEYRSAKEDFVVLDEVILEIEAQYRRFRELMGRKPDYFEGHAVASGNFFKGLKIVAERHGLRYLEMNFDKNPALFGDTRLYMHMESMKPDYDPMRSVKDISFHEGENETDVFVCHPGYLDAYILKASSLTIPRALEVEMLCSPGLKSWVKENDIQLIRYDEI